MLGEITPEIREAVEWSKATMEGSYMRILADALRDVLARALKAEFRASHHPSHTWDCTECQANFSDSDLDSRHDWTDAYYLDEAERELRGGK